MRAAALHVQSSQMPSKNGVGDDDATAMRPASDAPPRREPRFTPGTMLADRYRIVALLGSGGFGEVYRAEDTKLGQQVALKFLPQGVRTDSQPLHRLYDEVRLGRQVSHPNVCRLYDIGEWEGNHFLAMEYVDGEDLASLLRRIGKLPAGKAFEIARDICAGIAAAHGLGIIHRDLKPANVMIDGRGQARITDFGLAVVSEDLTGRHEIAGTPGYMAPEQFSGGTVTHKTDLYALGLILYEIFTGKKLFEGKSAVDSSSRRTTAKNLSSASGDARELDPVIQRVIARCVEENPDARPSSIHAVIASLPGGDPLQAAIDAGETPSPQMVAAAGEVGDLKASTAWALLIVSFLGLAAVTVLFGRTVLFRLVPLPKPPDALVDRVKTVLETAGYQPEAADTAYQFNIDEDFFTHMVEKNRSPDRWKTLPRLRPGVFVFEYRQSPRSMVPANREGRVVSDDPPMNVPGMTRVSVDAQGRLLSFAAIPPRQIRGGSPSATINWSKFLDLAGGDFEGLRQVPPRWTAPVDTDQKVAWEGYFRGDRKTPIRIEGAGYDGKAVWFKVIGPWASSKVREDDPRGPTRFISQLFVIILSAALIVGVVLALRNLRRGRGDRRTATRLALFVFVSGVIGYLFRLDHVSNIEVEFDLIGRGVSFALFPAVQAWILYLALEPYVRRRWPHTLIGWTRLFAGRFRDPMIGRDLLVGMCAGIATYLLRLLTIHAPTWFGQPALAPLSNWASPLIATRHLVYAWSLHQVEAVFISLMILLMLVLGLALFRRRWAAILGVWVICALGMSRAGEAPAVQIAFGALMAAVVLVVLIRFGLLAFVVTLFLNAFLDAVPLTLDPTAWYFGRSISVLILLAGAIVYGFWSALGQKPAFGVPVLEEG